jgi:DNA polymerase III epsilon subunit-like protein
VRAGGLESAILSEPADSSESEGSVEVIDRTSTLVFDTETSDLPRNWNRPASDVDNWPRLVQIAWVVCDRKLRVQRHYAAVVRPDGWEIAPDAVQIHRITTEKACSVGLPVVDVLRAFDAELQGCSVVVAHNLEFDQAVMSAEFIRAGIPHHFDDVQGFCTMRETTNMCRLEPRVRGEYKWPKLTELHELCTGRPHDEAP